MKQNSLVSFVTFGTGLRYLQDAKTGWSYRKENCIRDNIARVFEFLETNKMVVSRNASKRLETFRDELDDRLKDEKSRLEESDAKKIRDFAKELRFVVINEAKEVKAFFPSEKRYSLDYLYSDIAGVIGKDVFDKLSESAQEDIDEAGKCIVLERPTAAAFHMMRCCERTLLQLYKSIVKRGRKKPPLWAAMVTHLEERGEVDTALKGTLDIFRRGFRNPVAHPDQFYSIDSAQDLLGTSSQLLNLLVNHKAYKRDAT